MKKILCAVIALMMLTACSKKEEIKTPEITETPTPEIQVDLGQFGKFDSMFSKNGIIGGDGFYKSENVNVQLTRYAEDNLEYYVVDIYVRYIENMKTGFAHDRYGSSGEPTIKQALRHNAITAINGDYYTYQRQGLIVRNGEVYQNKSTKNDLCVLYKDGTMATYGVDEINVDEILANEPWQTWSFGPELLDNGQPMTEFNTRVGRANPRTAIGYFEPGHYCYVVVDGRNGISKGATMEKLSKIMYDLGCVSAYNLDGGKTSVLTFGTGVANDPQNSGRSVSDILYVAELGDAESWDLVSVETPTPTPLQSPLPTLTPTMSIAPPMVSPSPIVSPSPAAPPSPVILPSPSPDIITPDPGEPDSPTPGEQDTPEPEET